VADKRAVIEHIRALNGQLNMPAVLDYYGIDYDDNHHDRFKVICPFHNDSNPSLNIYTDNESGQDSWWCPVCSDNGDCFRFIQMMTANHKESTAVAIEIIKGIGVGHTTNPKYKKALEKRRTRKKIHLLQYRLGIAYRDWLSSLKEHPQYEEACQKVDEVLEQMDTLTESGEYRKVIDFIKEKTRKLKRLKGV
jgi:hypothetical protein